MILFIIFVSLLIQQTIHSMGMVDMPTAFQKSKIADIVDDIIAKKKDPDVFPPESKIIGFPLWWTCSSDEYIALSHQLLKLGANPNSVDSQFGFTPFEWIASGQTLQTTELLLKYGAAPATSHLHALCRPIALAMPVRIAIFKMFLEYGARIDIPDCSGKTLLTCARENFPGSELVLLLESHKKEKIA